MGQQYGTVLEVLQGLPVGLRTGRPGPITQSGSSQRERQDLCSRSDSKSFFSNGLLGDRVEYWTPEWTGNLLHAR